MARTVSSQEVADGVHVASSGGMVAWVLVTREDELLAVDAGLTRAWEDFALLCARLGRDPRALRSILLTHAHVDHTGFAARARAELGTRVHLHPDDERLLRHPLTSSVPERSPLLYLGHAAARENLGRMVRGGVLRTAVPAATIPLRPGALHRELPGTPELLHTPGHTMGHCSVLLRDAGVLVAGDALVTADPYTGRAGPRLMARGATRSMDHARRSLDLLERVDAPILVPGHGPVWHGGVAEAARQAREAEIT